MKQGRSMVALALLVVALLLGACGETPEAPPVGTAAPQLPETVTFAGGAQYLSDAEEIAVALAAGETKLLEQFTGLRVAEVTGSADDALPVSGRDEDGGCPAVSCQAEGSRGGCVADVLRKGTETVGLHRTGCMQGKCYKKQQKGQNGLFHG